MITESESIIRIATSKILVAIESAAPGAKDLYWKAGREWACAILFDDENGRWCKGIEAALQQQVNKGIIVKCLSSTYLPLLLGLRIRHVFQVGEGEIATAVRMIIDPKEAIDAPKTRTLIEL